MSGEAFGSKQIHAVPAALQNYEAITSIEFVEQDQKNDNIRSVAYRPIDFGAQTRIRVNIQEDLVDSNLDLDEAKSYISRLVQAGIFAWNYSYRPAQGTFTNVNTLWRLKIEFDPAVKHRPFIVEGESYFPDNYEQIVSILLCTKSE